MCIEVEIVPSKCRIYIFSPVNVEFRDCSQTLSIVARRPNFTDDLLQSLLSDLLQSQLSDLLQSLLSDLLQSLLSDLLQSLLSDLLQSLLSDLLQSLLSDLLQSLLSDLLQSRAVRLYSAVLSQHFIGVNSGKQFHQIMRIILAVQSLSWIDLYFTWSLPKPIGMGSCFSY